MKWREGWAGRRCCPHECPQLLSGRHFHSSSEILGTRHLVLSGWERREAQLDFYTCRGRSKGKKCLGTTGVHGHWILSKSIVLHNLEDASATEGWLWGDIFFHTISLVWKNMPSNKVIIRVHVVRPDYQTLSSGFCTTPYPHIHTTAWKTKRSQSK